MIYHSTQSDDYLWYLILRGKRKKKTKTHPNKKVMKGLQRSYTKGFYVAVTRLERFFIIALLLDEITLLYIE